MTITKISPLAPDTFPKIPNIAGVCMATSATGIKYKDRDDLLLMVFSPDTDFAGLFTKSATAAVSVHITKKVIANNQGLSLIHI